MFRHVMSLREQPRVLITTESEISLDIDLKIQFINNNKKTITTNRQSDVCVRIFY